MSDPASHAAVGAAVVALGAAFGVDPMAIYWATLGAVCSRTIQPRITTLYEILEAGGYWVMSAALGMAGATYGVLALRHFFPDIKAIDAAILYPLPAFLLALFGHVIVTRMSIWIRDWKSGERP